MSKPGSKGSARHYVWLTGFACATIATFFLLRHTDSEAPSATSQPIKQSLPLVENGSGSQTSSAPLVPGPPTPNNPPAEAALPIASRPAREDFASAWENENRPAFAKFKAWTEQFAAATPGDQSSLLKDGVELARVRRAELASLIPQDPRLAIESAVPMTVRATLPNEIQNELEVYVSGEARLALVAVTPAPGQQRVGSTYFHTAQVNGANYQAFVYGRRDEQATKLDVPLFGVALDQKLAVSESPLRVLERGEVPAEGKPVDALCPISGKSTPLAAGAPLNVDAPTAVEVGGSIHQLCSASHVGSYESQLIQTEDAAGPYSTHLVLGDSGQGGSGVVGRPPVSWTQGAKKVLVIRVDFSDKAGTPTNFFDNQTITEDYIVNRFNLTNGIRDFYTQASYNQTTLVISPTSGGDSPDVTEVLRLPKTASYYATNNDNASLHSDAESLATGAGYNLTNYDKIGVVFSYLGNLTNSQITYGGLGDVQGKNFWVNSAFDFRVVSHEIGHTYGLLHANLWFVTDGNPVSPAGTSLEYGDPFSVMSSGSTTIQNHFSQWEKNELQWMPDAAVTTISSPGTYRVYRFDHQNATLTNALALKIVRNNSRDYWIGFRQAITGNSSLMNGAYIVWGYNKVQQGDLLDLTTPGSNTNDAALAIGATFNDTAAGITIHPLAKGGTAPNEYLDVQVSFTPRIQWVSTNYTFDEQLGNATLALARTGASNGIVSVKFATTNGTAIAPGDYTATNGTVTWADGDVSQKTVTIPIVPDASAEGVETFTVAITNITGGVVVNASNAVVTIADSGAFDATLAQDFVNNTVLQVVVQPDGKLLLGGYFTTNLAGFTQFRRGGFSRLNADGTLDQTFGNGLGVNITPVWGMALQPDGKILIGGEFTSVHGVARNHIARLNADGSLDTSFNPGTGANSTVYAVALQPDGKVLVGGAFTTVSGTAREYVARLNTDGSLDSTFVGPDFGDTGGWRIQCLAIQPDNKILAGGVFYFPAASFKASIVRMNANGSVDSSFNPGGGAHVSGNTSDLRSVWSVALQTDGNIILAGDFTAYDSVDRNRLARVTSTGALDTSFVPSADGTCQTALVQADGKILVGGSFTTLNSTALNHYGRLKTDGTLDSAFDVGSGSSGTVYTFAMQPDGKAVIGTLFGTIKGVGSRTTARLYAGLPGLPGTAQFTSTSSTGVEGGAALLTVSRTGGSYGAVSVNYGMSTNTAGASDFTVATGTLSWTNGETASKTISIPLTADGIAESDETFFVNLGVPMGGAYVSSPGFTTTTITTAFSNWKNAHFTPLEALISQISGDNADPDGDGMVNLMEYATGHDPKIPDSGGKVATSVQTASGTNYLTLSFRRAPTPDLSYTPQVTGDLNSSFTNGPVQVGSPASNGDGTETVTWRDTVPMTQASQRLMRLQINRIP